MARITKATIQKVKDTISISSVFEWLGTTVITRGRNTMAFCPFCEDFNSKNPGCSLDDTQGLFYCHVCHASGDMISAVQQHEDCSFPEAIERLAAQFNIPVEYEQSSDPVAESRRKKLVSVLEAAQAEFLAQRDDPHFAEFLESRHLDMESADRFELGISLYTKADEVVRRLESQFGRQALIDCGLCYFDEQRNQTMLRFRNRLMFPIRTAPGTLVAFGGRDLTGKSPAKYKNSPESELFKKRNVMYGMNIAKKFMSRSKRAIVCEGYMDTIALQSHGFEYTVGAMGTALTQYNLNKLASFADTIYISLDSDQAGINAAMRTAETIPENFAAEVRVLTIPEVECSNEEEVRDVSRSKAEEYLWTNDEEGNRVRVSFPVMVPMAKDPDEFFNHVGYSHEDFEKILEGSRDVFLFCAMTLVRKHVEDIDREMAVELPDAAKIARSKMQAKRDVSNFMQKVYRKTNIYQRQNVANYMISSLRLVDTFEQLESEWRHAASFSGKAPEKPKTQVKSTFSSEITREEDMLIATLYFHPESRDVIKENIEDIQTVFTSAVRESVFNKLNDAYGRGLDAKGASDEMDKDETKELARIVMTEEESDEDGELSSDTIVNICRKIEKHALENKIERESNAANPDLMTIIALKMKLAELQR